MTREQQNDILRIIKRKGGYMEGHAIRGDISLYTNELKTILSLGAEIWCNNGNMEISNWEDYPKKPVPFGQLEFRAFKQGEYNLVLKGVADEDSRMNHDHIEVWDGSKLLGYMHIDRGRIQWWSENVHRSGTINI